MNEITNKDFDGVFGLHNDHSTISEVINAFKDKFPEIDVEIDFVAFAIIANFYTSQELPLCGKLQWMKRDYLKLINTGTCRPVELYRAQIAPKIIVKKVFHRENEIIDTFGT